MRKKQIERALRCLNLIRYNCSETVLAEVKFLQAIFEEELYYGKARKRPYQSISPEHRAKMVEGIKKYHQKIRENRNETIKSKT